MPIELVPNNKHGLTLASPLIAGAGAVGYADAWPPGVTAAMFGSDRHAAGIMAAAPRANAAAAGRDAGRVCAGDWRS